MTEVNSLAEFLCSAQREESGAASADRFDYQKDWALLRLLTLHAAEGEYVLLCEFHEDITVVDSAQYPTRAVFYQIKTDKSRRWSTQRLLSKKKGKDGKSLPSILGKLCDKASHLSGQDVEFHLVTNSGFSIKHGGAKTTYIDSPGDYLASTTLSSVEWQAVSDALKDEIGVDLEAALSKTLHLSVADLPLQMHQHAALGMVTTFLEEQAPGVTISSAAFYRTLFDEMRRRTSAAIPSGGLDERCRIKGIDRPTFERMLNAAVKCAPERESWAAVRRELLRENVSLAKRLELDDARKRVYFRWLRPSDTALRRVARLLIYETRRALENGNAATLSAAADIALAIAKKNPIYVSADLSDLESLAIAMEGLYEGTNDQISASDQQPTEKDA